MNYEPAIKQVKELVKKKLPGLVKLADKVKWLQHETQLVSAPAEASRTAVEVNLYPSLLQIPHDVSGVLATEIGHLHFRQLDAAKQRRWTMKLVLPEEADLKEIKEKLQAKKFLTYRILVESFLRAVPKFTAINVVNALIANRVPIEEGFNLNIFNWGPTHEYANRKRYHSLVPLVSAYCPRPVFNDFGAAISELIVHDLQHVRESTVRSQLRRLLTDLAGA